MEQGQEAAPTSGEGGRLAQAPGEGGTMGGGGGAAAGGRGGRGAGGGGGLRRFASLAVLAAIVVTTVLHYNVRGALVLLKGLGAADGWAVCGLLSV